MPAIFLSKQPFWLWPNLLSLDAPLIAVIWQLLLLRSVHARVSPAEPVVLALCVWTIYLLDRVFDVLRTPDAEWEPERKKFYRSHLALAGALSGILLVAIVPLSWFFLRRATFWAGLKLGLPLAGYLALVHLLPPHWRARWPRELSVACIFTLGAFLPLWAGHHAGARLLTVPAILFVALCWWNIAAIETWEWQQTSERVATRPNAWSVWIGLHLPFLGAATAAFGLLAKAMDFSPPAFAFAAALSGFLLAVLALARPRLPVEFVRVAADLALCTPVIAFLLGW